VLSGTLNPNIPLPLYVTGSFTDCDLQIAGYTSKGIGPSSEIYPVRTDVKGLLCSAFFAVIKPFLL